jgi:hypothetical protein
MSQPSLSYPLGSHRQWRETLAALLVPPVIASVLLCIISQCIGGAFGVGIGIAVVFFVAAVGVVVLNGLNLPGTDETIRWLSDITVNLSHGWAAEDGIHFRKWFRRRFVSWKSIARVEYWPDRQGRIELYLYSQRSPVVFMTARHGHTDAAAAGESGAVNYISLKLKETWPGSSTFLTSFENGHSKPGPLATWLGKLSIWQKAFANVLLMLLILLLVYTYVAIRIATRQYFWKAMAVIWGFLVIGWFCLRLLRKSKMEEKGDSLN